jgi:CRP/FNR family transcriptional regulator
MTQSVTNCHLLLPIPRHPGILPQRTGGLIPLIEARMRERSMATIFAQAVRRPVAPPPVAAAQAGSFRTLFCSRPAETLDANEVLFWEGDAAEDLFEIVSGCLRLYKLMADGRRAITGFMFPGEILGVSFKDRYLFTAEAVTSVKLRRYSRAQMHASLARMPGLSREILAMACDELSAAQDQMLLLGRKTAEERIASFLLAVAKRTSKDGASVREFDLPMARLDMADFLGLTIETVSRVLTKLKTKGIIALPSPHRVLVNKLSGLRHVAGEDEPDFATHAPAQRTVRGAVWPS